MPTGEAFTDGQVREISGALSTASAETGLHFSAFVGTPEGSPRVYAERLLAALEDRTPIGVMILVAPENRRLEIVTGPAASRRVSDRACALAALSMRTSFAGGDLVGGLVTGVRMLAEAAGVSREVATTSYSSAPAGSATALGARMHAGS